MDINSNMEIENFELVIDKVYEGEITDIDSSTITEEMVLTSIRNNLDSNRELNRSVDIAIYDLVRGDLLEYSNDNVRGM